MYKRLICAISITWPCCLAAAEEPAIQKDLVSAGVKPEVVKILLDQDLTTKEIICSATRDELRALKINTGQAIRITNFCTPEVPPEVTVGCNANATDEALLECIIVKPQDSIALEALRSRPLVQKAAAKTARWAVVNDDKKVSTTDTLAYLTFLSKDTAAPQDRYKGKRTVALDAALGLASDVWIHPLIADAFITDGLDEAGADWSNVPSEVLNALLWARLTQHKFLPSILGWAEDLAIQQKATASPIADPALLRIVEDYKARIEERDTDALSVDVKKKLDKQALVPSRVKGAAAIQPKVGATLIPSSAVEIEPPKTDHIMRWPRLGINVQDMSEGMARMFRMSSPRGAVVKNLAADSTAQGLLKIGEVILSYDGIAVANAKAFPPLVEASRVGQVVVFTVLRGSKEVSIPVTVGETPNSGRYQDNGDGTVTDINTKLMWKRCSEGQDWNGTTCTGNAIRISWNDLMPDGAQRVWPESLGYDDWRVPNKEELMTLVYCSSGTPKFWNDTGRNCEGQYQSPAIDTIVFPNWPSSVLFWSSSVVDNSSSYAWYVSFNNGTANQTNLNQNLAVQFVRGGQ